MHKNLMYVYQAENLDSLLDLCIPPPRLKAQARGPFLARFREKRSTSLSFEV